MKLSIIHTSFVSVESLTALCAEIMPGTQVGHIVDDTLLPEVVAANGITEGVIKRVAAYAKQAEIWGADAILNQCSSVGEAAELAAPSLKIPYVRIDVPMAEEAVRLGERIAVVATVASTMKPSTSIVRAAASRASRQVEVIPVLVDGALEVLMKHKDRAKHNRMVRARIEEVAAEVDVVVLAQGSMIVLLPELEHISKPVLSSPRLGIERMRDILHAAPTV